MSQAARRSLESEAEPVRVLGRGLRAQKRTHLTLRTVRDAVGKTQMEVAQESKINQADISRLEGRADLDECQVATLHRYVEARGSNSPFRQGIVRPQPPLGTIENIRGLSRATPRTQRRQRSRQMRRARPWSRAKSRTEASGKITTQTISVTLGPRFAAQTILVTPGPRFAAQTILVTPGPRFAAQTIPLCTTELILCDSSRLSSCSA